MVNKKLFEEWKAELYYEWLMTELRPRVISTIQNLVRDLEEQSAVHKRAYKRIPELLDELKEIDIELEKEE